MIVNKAIIANQVDTCVDSVKLFSNHLFLLCQMYIYYAVASLFLSLSLSLIKFYSESSRFEMKRINLPL